MKLCDLTDDKPEHGSIADALSDPSTALTPDQWGALYAKLWGLHDHALARIERLEAALMLCADHRRPQ